jgi:hypothetical protein
MRCFKFGRTLTLVGIAALGLISVTGCRQLPGSPGTQGAAIGGLGGAAAGAAIGGERHRVLGALLGGAVGAGGGYLIGANSDRITGRDQHAAEESVRAAQSRPATPQDATRAQTADINSDGFVTMDEVVAMRAAGFSDQQMLDRMASTGQVFELTTEQQRYLTEHGVSQYVVDRMLDLNRDVRDRLVGQQDGGVIGRPVRP